MTVVAYVGDVDIHTLNAHTETTTHNNHNHNHNNNNTPPRLAGLTDWWGSAASQFLTLAGELAVEARWQPGGSAGAASRSDDG